MTHPFSEELISAYLDGELSAADKTRVEHALRDDADLKALYSQLQTLRTTLQAMPRQQPDQDLTEWVLRQAERRMLSGSVPATEPLEAKPVEADRAVASTHSTDRSKSGPSEQSPVRPASVMRSRDNRSPFAETGPANRWRWRVVLGTLATTAALLLAVFSISWHGAPKMVAESATGDSPQQRAIPAPADDQLATDSAFGMAAPADESGGDAADADGPLRDENAPESSAMLGRLSRDEGPELSESPVPPRLAGKSARSFSSGASGYGGGVMPPRGAVSATSKPLAPTRSGNASQQPRAMALSSVSPPLPAVAKEKKIGQAMVSAKRRATTAAKMVSRLKTDGLLVVKVALNKLPDRAKDSNHGGAVAGPAQRVVQLVQSEDGIAVVSPFALTTSAPSAPERSADKPAKLVRSSDSLAIDGQMVVYAEGPKVHVRALLERLSRRDDMVVSLVEFPNSRMMDRPKTAVSSQAGSRPAVTDGMTRSKRPAKTQRFFKKEEDGDRKVVGQAAKDAPSMGAVQEAMGVPELPGQLKGTRKRSQRVKPIAEPEGLESDKENGLAIGGGRAESQQRLPGAEGGLAQSEPVAEPNTAYIVLRVTRPHEVPTSRSQKK